MLGKKRKVVFFGGVNPQMRAAVAVSVSGIFEIVAVHTEGVRRRLVFGKLARFWELLDRRSATLTQVTTSLDLLRERTLKGGHLIVEDNQRVIIETHLVLVERLVSTSVERCARDARMSSHSSKTSSKFKAAEDFALRVVGFVCESAMQEGCYAALGLAMRRISSLRVGFDEESLSLFRFVLSFIEEVRLALRDRRASFEALWDAPLPNESKVKNKIKFSDQHMLAEDELLEKELEVEAEVVLGDKDKPLEKELEVEDEVVLEVEVPNAELALKDQGSDLQHKKGKDLFAAAKLKLYIAEKKWEVSALKEHAKFQFNVRDLVEQLQLQLHGGLREVLDVVLKNKCLVGRPVDAAYETFVDLEMGESLISPSQQMVDDVEELMLLGTLAFSGLNGGLENLEDLANSEVFSLVLARRKKAGKVAAMIGKKIKTAHHRKNTVGVHAKTDLKKIFTVVHVPPSAFMRGLVQVIIYCVSLGPRCFSAFEFIFVGLHQSMVDIDPSNKFGMIFVLTKIMTLYVAISTQVQFVGDLGFFGEQQEFCNHLEIVHFMLLAYNFLRGLARRRELLAETLQNLDGKLWPDIEQKLEQWEEEEDLNEDVAVDIEFEQNYGAVYENVKNLRDFSDLEREINSQIIDSGSRVQDQSLDDLGRQDEQVSHEEIKQKVVDVNEEENLDDNELDMRVLAQLEQQAQGHVSASAEENFDLLQAMGEDVAEPTSTVLREERFGRWHAKKLEEFLNLTDYLWLPFNVDELLHKADVNELSGLFMFENFNLLLKSDFDVWKGLGREEMAFFYFIKFVDGYKNTVYAKLVVKLKILKDKSDSSFYSEFAKFRLYKPSMEEEHTFRIICLALRVLYAACEALKIFKKKSKERVKFDALQAEWYVKFVELGQQTTRVILQMPIEPLNSVFSLYSLEEYNYLFTQQESLNNASMQVIDPTVSKFLVTEDVVEDFVHSLKLLNVAWTINIPTNIQDFVYRLSYMLDLQLFIGDIDTDTSTSTSTSVDLLEAAFSEVYLICMSSFSNVKVSDIYKLNHGEFSFINDIVKKFYMENNSGRFPIEISPGIWSISGVGNYNLRQKVLSLLRRIKYEIFFVEDFFLQVLRLKPLISRFNYFFKKDFFIPCASLEFEDFYLFVDGSFAHSYEMISMYSNIASLAMDFPQVFDGKNLIDCQNDDIQEVLDKISEYNGKEWVNAAISVYLKNKKQNEK